MMTLHMQCSTKNRKILQHRIVKSQKLNSTIRPQNSKLRNEVPGPDEVRNEVLECESLASSTHTCGPVVQTTQMQL